MNSRKQAYAIFLLLAFSTLSFIINSSKAADCVSSSGAISVSWGSEVDDKLPESTLKGTCDTGKYNIILIQYLDLYYDGSEPTLYINDYCGIRGYPPCSKLEPEIKHCQSLGIKVFLSMWQISWSNKGWPSARGSHLVRSGEGRCTQSKRKDCFQDWSNTTPKPVTCRDDSPSILASSSDVTKDLADYVVKNFLSGNPGPLGSVSLDGIDIVYIDDQDTRFQWDELVKEINQSTTDRKIYLSASPHYIYPDYVLDPAIKTGLFDYIWVEFFELAYSPENVTILLKVWETWTSHVHNSRMFLGLHLYKDLNSYIPPEVLKSDVLPTAKKASNYGGVMLFQRSYDIKSGYSDQIKNSVTKSCRCVCDKPAQSLSV